MNLSDSQKRLVRSLADQAAGMIQQEKIWAKAGLRNDFYAGAAIGLKTAARYTAAHFHLQNQFPSKLNSQN